VVYSVNALDFGFKVEAECELFNSKTYKLNTQKLIYKKKYSETKHLLWIGTYGKNIEEFFLVATQETVDEMNDFFSALEISKKGIHEFDIVIPKKKDKKDFSKIIEKALEQRYLSAIFCNIKTTPELITDIVNMEVKHQQIIAILTIGLIYCKTGQTDPLEMFLNNPSHTFQKFVKWMLSNKEWRGFPVEWHVATTMDEEAHRRLIGNSQCIVFFKENDGTQFDVSQVQNLGTVTQFFIVVEPYHDRYRLGFFQKLTLKEPFGPQLPATYLFDKITLCDFFFTKVHNGYMAAWKCSEQISPLYETPKLFAIRKITEKYTPKGWLNKIRNQ
jgi:hypothetical protein